MRRLFAALLRQIGQGTWLRDGVSKRLATSEPGLELWRTKVTKGGRIIWQVGTKYALSELLAVPTGLDHCLHAG